MENFMGKNYEEKEINLTDLINIFLRRRKFFLLISISIFLLIIIYQFSKPYTPIYLATFDIGISEKKPFETFFSTSLQEPVTQIGTVTQRVISTLLSTELAEKIVDTLSLYAYIKNGNKELKIHTKILYEFKEPIGPLKIKIDKEKIEVFDKKGRKIKDGLLEEYINIGPLEFKIIPPQKEIKKLNFEIIFYPKKKVAFSLRNSLSIKVLEADKIEKETGFGGVPFSGEGASKKIVTAKTIFPGLNLIGILRINVYWSNPDDVFKIAQILSQEIIKEDIREKSIQFIQSRKFIESQLSFYKEKLNELEQKIKNFKENKKIVNLDASTQAIISQLTQIESRKNQLEIEEKILKEFGEYLTRGDKKDTIFNFAVTLIQDPSFQNLYFELLKINAELKGLLKEYSSYHPRILEAKAKLNGLKEQLKEEINKRISSIKTEIQSVEEQISTLYKKLEKIPYDEIQLAELERDKETAEKLYTFFAEKYEETRVKEAGVTSDLKIVNPPIVSLKPVNAKKPLLIILIALIISVLIGVAGVFTLEYFDNTIKDTETLKLKTGLPVFGLIPLLNKEKKGIKDYLKGKKLERELKILTDSQDMESFRKLFINLEFAHPEKKYKMIYITSPGPEEGKTFIALNLSFILSQIGKKVITIDTDFRKKKWHLTDIIKVEKEEGFFEVLRGNVSLKEAIKEIKKEDENIKALIHALPVGKIPPDPFVFLHSQKMKEILEELKKDYDYIIIDGVPVLLFADAGYLAVHTDGVIIVVKYGKTKFKEIEDARDALLSSGAKIIGAVINGVPKERGHYYYYYKYYSKYYKK
jgi:capsular exopolysaccharide synthesis family protein